MRVRTRVGYARVGADERGGRMNRDDYLRSRGIDPDVFRKHMREAEIGNECDTDEYRETQPAKGLLMVAEALEDTGLQGEDYFRLVKLTAEWLGEVEDERSSYGGSEQLKPVLGMVFDRRWEQGYASLYQSSVDDMDTLAGDVDYYLEYEVERGSDA